MNIERLTTLRDTLVALDPSRFNMKFWARDFETSNPIYSVSALEHNCGTAACIGGWAEALFDPDRKFHHNGVAHAGELLGLDADVAERLFFPRDDDHAWGATSAQAAKVVDHLINTGRVEWSVIA